MRIIYFDGICNLCNNFVDFIIKIDKKNKFLYASLQGISAKENLPADDLNLSSVIFYNNGLVTKKSKAVLHILGEVGGFYWVISKILMIFPVFFSDFFYELIAKNRYYLFGRKNSCRMPTENEKKLFLD